MPSTTATKSKKSVTRPTASNKILKLIQDHQARFVDLRFTDSHGKEHHVSVGADMVNAEFLAEGKMFDGSSIAGWKSINDSDMILMPDANNVFIDPFFDETTLVVRCDVVDPTTMQGYNRDPRSVAKNAEAYLKTTGIADTFYVGYEAEFFIFDDVRWKVDMDHVFYQVDSDEAAWNSETRFEGGNIGHRPRVKGGYFPVPPVDSSQDIRSAMCVVMHDLGIQVETHHHEVATGNQNEINTRFDSLLRKADELQVYKYIVHNVAHVYGKTATFMPKPLVGDNGNGMHCHQSLFKKGKAMFSGDKYGGLSQEALYYIGGIIKHARALNAFTNPTTNSYKRLVPGFEAPVILAYSANNRSAAIRVPHCANPKGRRLEVRFPDPSANPYLAFSAMLMAGLDGIANKIDPGKAMDFDLYNCPPEKTAKIPTVSSSLEQSLEALNKDRKFLTTGGVFTDDLIDGYISLKMKEVQALQMTTHPLEFELYYSV